MSEGCLMVKLALPIGGCYKSAINSYNPCATVGFDSKNRFEIII